VLFSDFHQRTKKGRMGIYTFFVLQKNFGRAKIIYQRPTPWSALQWLAEIGWALQYVELPRMLSIKELIYVEAGRVAKPPPVGWPAWR
jgi:hypothetical protein